MAIIQEPFRVYNLNKRVDSFTVRLNDKERERLDQDKKTIEQKKDSTAIKQLALIGSYVIRDQKMMAVLGVLFKNKRNNKRIGVVDFD